MADEQHRKGPGQGVFNALNRMGSVVIDIIETRIQLIATELEEEKANFIQLLLMVGITLLLFAFGLACLIALIIFSFDPSYRYYALLVITVVLVVAALVCIGLTLKKARNKTLLVETREQLRLDRELLRRKNNEKE